MCVDLFSIGPVTVHGYGLMIAIGIIVALLVAEKRAAKLGMNTDYIYTATFLIAIIGFLGGKLMFMIVEWRQTIADPLAMLKGNGFVVYGGIITGFITALVYCHMKKISFPEYADLLTPCVAIAQGFGRIGCFMAGCCYGRPTNSWIGVIFKNSPYAPNGVKVIPTQLFSSAGDFLIFLLLSLYSKKRKTKGQVTAMYFILYSIGRFIIEIFRNDDRGRVGNLSTAQFTGIFMLICGLVAFIILQNRKACGISTDEKQ